MYQSDCREILKNISGALTNSVFYPACELDGTPVKFFNEHFAEYGIDCYVYADYAMNGDKLEEVEETFRYYHVASRHELKESDLTARGTDYRKYALILSEEEIRRQKEIVFGMFGDTISPFGRMLVYERNSDVGPDRGPDRFTLIYVGGEAVATYAALYRIRDIAPKALAIIHPGTGFGGNYTDFFNPDAAFMKLISGGKNQPEFLYIGEQAIMPYKEYIRKYGRTCQVLP